ncbi:MAG: DUF1501 domain-containing protein [Planctomycetes bacterium]|nr:DUF1501 domain-containing protein [Planctomycetota bacterium]
MQLDRRHFLGGSLGVFGALALGRGALARPGAPQRRLVIVELAGGNDGLNTLVPMGEKIYLQSRERIGFAPEKLLPISADRALHPRLVGLQNLFGTGGISAVEGTGYPNPNRSHFSSQDIWYTARPTGRASGDGWVGRLLEELYPDDREKPHAFHVGAGTPYFLHSTTRPVAYLEIPAAFRFAENAAAIEAALARKDKLHGDSPDGRIESIARSAQAASGAVREAVARYKPRLPYPKVQLGTDLRNAAAILSADFGARVVTVRQDGYDFHDDQLRRQDVLLHELDACLSTFWADFLDTSAGESVSVLVFSEFGRRVADNASGGTDHGTAGPVLLLGRSVKPGLHGAHPSLADLDEGDLRFTTDFRSVYASVIENWLGAPSECVLGARYPTLPLFT